MGVNDGESKQTATSAAESSPDASNSKIMKKIERSWTIGFPNLLVCDKRFMKCQVCTPVKIVKSTSPSHFKNVVILICVSQKFRRKPNTADMNINLEVFCSYDNIDKVTSTL